MLTDTGIIKKYGFNQDKWQVKYWASDILVLHLYSTVAVGKIFSVEGQQDQTIQVALCLVLLFMRVNLVSVNFKGTIQARERVMMLWSSFLFFLHVYVVHIKKEKFNI